MNKLKNFIGLLLSGISAGILFNLIKFLTQSKVLALIITLVLAIPIVYFEEKVMDRIWKSK